MQVFHTSISWWSFPGFWVTASLLRSHQRCSLNGLNLSSDFQLFLSPIEAFGDCSRDAPDIPQFSFFSGKVQEIVSLFTVVHRDGKSHSKKNASSLFFLIMTWSGFLAGIWWSVCIWKSKRISCILFFWTDSDTCMQHLFVWSKFNSCTIPQSHPIMSALIPSLC